MLWHLTFCIYLKIEVMLCFSQANYFWLLTGAQYPTGLAGSQPDVPRPVEPASLPGVVGWETHQDN